MSLTVAELEERFDPVWPASSILSLSLSLCVFLVMSNQINWAERCDKEGAPWGAMLLPPSLSSPPPPIHPLHPPALSLLPVAMMVLVCIELSYLLHCTLTPPTNTHKNHNSPAQYSHLHTAATHVCTRSSTADAWEWFFITIITKTNIATHLLNSFYFKAVLSSSMAVSITAALKVMNDVSEALHNNQHCLSLFIDLPLTLLVILVVRLRVQHRKYAEHARCCCKADFWACCCCLLHINRAENVVFRFFSFLCRWQWHPLHAYRGPWVAPTWTALPSGSCSECR